MCFSPSPPIPSSLESASYMLGESFIPWTPVVRYLGVLINSVLSWSDHCKVAAAKATRSLNYLRHSLWGATQPAKAAAYVSLIRPLLEYACVV